MVTTTPPIEELVSRFWKIEDTPSAIPPAVNPEDHECEEHFKKTFKRDKYGRYIVSLPFKNGVSIPSSNRAASWESYKRLKKKLQHDTSEMQDYQAFLKEYLDLGHMPSVRTPSAYVIPYTSVFKKDSNRIRVVFNASALDIDGILLNDRLSTGPKLQPDLSKIISKFRTRIVALCTDIHLYTDSTIVLA
ncbi:hypothetical protein AAG570_013357 [Ranatra chinensis]|uniref:Uncharacterized protein n=1 Tax=Ranatra chinensis TaxID=642074 RepID=A0ABD0YBX0_9HEMI